eukprot:gene14295-biopygen602
MILRDFACVGRRSCESALAVATPSHHGVPRVGPGPRGGSPRPRMWAPQAIATTPTGPTLIVVAEAHGARGPLVAVVAMACGAHIRGRGDPPRGPGPTRGTPWWDGVATARADSQLLLPTQAKSRKIMKDYDQD